MAGSCDHTLDNIVADLHDYMVHDLARAYFPINAVTQDLSRARCRPSLPSRVYTHIEIQLESP
jgi:hypothetical protein